MPFPQVVVAILRTVSRGIVASGRYAVAQVDVDLAFASLLNGLFVDAVSENFVVQHAFQIHILQVRHGFDDVDEWFGVWICET